MKLSQLRNRFHYCIYFCVNAIRRHLFSSIAPLQIEDAEKTVQDLLEKKLSISRYGDGEFNVLFGVNGLFQTTNCKLQNKLANILNNPISNHVVGIPIYWKTPWSLKYESFEYWSSYLLRAYDERIRPFLPINRIYYDATFTRFYMDHRSNKQAQRIIPQIKKLWNNRSVCIVEGEYTRFAVNNDLLDNARTVSRIICPAQNAFDRYDEILDAIRSQERYDVYLIALGMTATCLAYDLAKEGYWAIDIGHADIEYEWFIRKAKSKISIPGKYVSESDNAMMTSNIDLQQYKTQILYTITQ